MRLAALSFGSLVWALAIYGTTQFHTLDLPIGHTICGPWGCAAAPESLLGYHLFWLVVLAPLAALTCRAASRGAGLALSRALAGLGLTAALAIVAGSAAAWLLDGGAAQHAVQRGLFVLAATPDAPMLQLLVAGGVGRLAVPGRTTAARRAVEASGLSRENQTA
ncbi:hypothetical protein [Botrimarina sp.]|uniref:hypothetical protein n=1 Tax=Botrimarina sp. TaxID=2795802 RepID=UPI0032EB9C61